MQLIEKEFVIGKCLELTQGGEVCSKIAESLYSDAEIWFGGIGVGILSWLVTLFVRQRIIVNNNFDPLVEQIKEIVKLQGGASASPGPESIVIARFCSDDERQTLLAQLSCLKYIQSKQPIGSFADLPSKLTKIAEVDVDRYFRLRGADRAFLPDHGIRKVKEHLFGATYALSPNFISWSDDGAEILVACDMQGIRRYAVQDGQLRLAQDFYSHYPPYIWRRSPEWCRWSVHPHLSLLPCYFIRDVRLEGRSSDLLIFNMNGSEPKALNLGISRMNVGGLSAIGHPERFTNPWRPGRRELLMMDSGGVASSDGGARAISVVAIDEALEKKDLRAAMVRRYELDSLLPPGHYVQGYAWHESGQFVFVDVGSYQLDSRHILMLGYDDGRVIAATRRGIVMVGWVPDIDRMLVTHTSNVDCTGRKEFAVVDILGGDEVSVEKSTDNVHLRKLMLEHDESQSNYSSYSRKINADGSMWVSADGATVRIYPTREQDEQEGARAINFQHKGLVICSPVDPSLFASLGEADGKSALRLWRIE